jgi:hypothetical protein
VAKGGLNKWVNDDWQQSGWQVMSETVCDCHWASVEVVEMKPHVRRIMDNTSTCNRVLLCHTGSVWHYMICDRWGRSCTVAYSICLPYSDICQWLQSNSWGSWSTGSSLLTVLWCCLWIGLICNVIWEGLGTGKRFWDMNNVKRKIRVFCAVWASSYRHFGGLYCHQNISTHLLGDTASCPRRLESSARESKNLGGVTPICV